MVFVFGNSHEGDGRLKLCAFALLDPRRNQKVGLFECDCPLRENTLAPIGSKLTRLVAFSVLVSFFFVAWWRFVSFWKEKSDLNGSICCANARFPSNAGSVENRKRHISRTTLFREREALS